MNAVEQIKQRQSERESADLMVMWNAVAERATRNRKERLQREAKIYNSKNFLRSQWFWKNKYRLEVIEGGKRTVIDGGKTK